MNATATALPRRTSRLVIRRLRPTDLAAFQAYRSDAELAAYQGWSPLPDDATGAFLAEMHGAPFFRPGTWFQVGMARAVDDTLIGDIGICLDADGEAAEAGFTLGTSSQGQGLATEAVAAVFDWIFASTRAESIRCITDARNTASIRLLERLDMPRIHAAEAIFRGSACMEYTYVLKRALPEGAGMDSSTAG